MSESTDQSKSIIDFVWEWSEQYADWSRLLISKIIANDANLTNDERAEVFDMFLESLDLKKRLERTGISKPVFRVSDKSIFIRSLSNVIGVNQLADGQKIEFSKNLTVIYGSNGSGKTGYGRILKSLGFSYEGPSPILPNINDVPVAQRATIEYTVDEVLQSFMWTGSNSNADLQTIALFNNNSVNISLGEDRTLIVSPRGFYIFELLGQELVELQKLLDTEIRKYDFAFPWLASINPNTPQLSYLSQLNSKATDKEISDISSFTEHEEKELKSLKDKLLDLNISLISKKIMDAKRDTTELIAMKKLVGDAKDSLSKSNISKLIQCEEEIKSLESKEVSGISEIGKEMGIRLYSSKSFEQFLKAADAYIQTLQLPDYPNDKDETCIYCLQPLEDRAKTLLTSYRAVFHDTTKNEMDRLKGHKKSILENIRNSSVAISIRGFSFGEIEGSPVQPQWLKDYNQKIQSISQSINDGNIPSEYLVDVNFDLSLRSIIEKLEQLENEIRENEELLSNISYKAEEITKKIAELEARLILSTKTDEIKKAIDKIKIKALLESKRGQFNSNSLSRKTTEARNYLVKDNFIDKFNDELKALRKFNLNIELDFGTTRGNSRLQQKIRSKYILRDILSEGEQKAVAIAEYLAELQLNASKSPVVFDDPVNSLDHTIIEDVARRLLKLSTDRQVVIFTHSILLVNEIYYHVKQGLYKELEVAFFDVEKNYNKAGFVSASDMGNSKVTEYIKKTNTLLNNSPKNRSESEVASEGYGYLRSAVELLVEWEVLKGTVKRYQKNIALSKFMEIDGELLDQHKEKLIELFERSSGFINGHSDPIERDAEPTIDSLKNDHETLVAIYKAFNSASQPKAQTQASKMPLASEPTSKSKQ